MFSHPVSVRSTNPPHSARILSPMSRYGTAAEAAKTLGVSLSQFNGIRANLTYELDAVTQAVRPLDPGRRGDRAYLRCVHLVAPAVAGHKLPGCAWEFNLPRLRELRERGWQGADAATKE